MEVGVQIAGNAVLPGVETTFTENVSPRGARVFSSRPWRLNDRLTLTTVTGVAMLAANSRARISGRLLCAVCAIG